MPNIFDVSVKYILSTVSVLIICCDLTHAKGAEVLKNQLQGLSHERITENANRSNWNQLYPGERQKIFAEIERRASLSPSIAQELTLAFLESFALNKDMRGSYVHVTFLDTLRKAVSPVAPINEEFLREVVKRFANLQNVFSDDSDNTTLSDAKKLLFKEYFVERVNRRLTDTRFADLDIIYFTLLGAKNRQSADGSWLLQQPQFGEIEAKVFPMLLKVATQQDMPRLIAVYKQGALDLDRPAILNRMYELAPDQTINLARERIDLFGEKSSHISLIIDEVLFLRQHGTPQIIAALMEKLLRLLALAEEQKDESSRALILSALTGSRGGSLSSSSGAGGGSGLGRGTGSGGDAGGSSASGQRLTWAQVSSGNYSNGGACETPARNALQLYKHNLMNGTEIQKALQDIVHVRCDNRSNRASIFGVVVSICEEANRKQDEAISEICRKDVFNVLAAWLNSPESLNENKAFVAQSLSRLYLALPLAQRNNLRPTCRMSITDPTVYDRRERHIREGSFLYIQRNRSGNLEVKRCDEVGLYDQLVVNDAELAYKKSDEQYVKRNGQWVFNWSNISSNDSCAQSILSDPQLFSLTAYLNFNENGILTYVKDTHRDIESRRSRGFTAVPSRVDATPMSINCEAYNSDHQTNVPDECKIKVRPPYLRLETVVPLNDSGARPTEISCRRYY